MVYLSFEKLINSTSKLMTFYKHLKTLSVLLIIVASWLSHTVYAMDAADTPDRAEHSPKPALGSIPIPHDYLAVAYNIKPYEGISESGRRDICIRHKAHKDLHPLPLSEFVDEDWVIVCDMYQAILRQISIDSDFVNKRKFEEYFDEYFTYKMLKVNYIRKGAWRLHPRETLFFFWKQTAWVDADLADALSEALTTGFTDKVPINPEWAAYWRRRAHILREQPQWYKPRDRNNTTPEETARVWAELGFPHYTPPTFKE